MLAKIDAMLAAAENRDTFFERIAKIFSPMDHRYQEIERVYNETKDAFRNKFRDGGERYFEHLRSVAIIIIDYLGITDYEVIMAALRHDIIEDIESWTLIRLRDSDGKNVALYVDYVSKRRKEEFSTKAEREEAFFEKLRSAPRKSIIIKLADVLHNMRTMWKCTEQKRLDKIRQYEQHYRFYARREIILMHELEGAYWELKKGCPVLPVTAKA